MYAPCIFTPHPVILQRLTGLLLRITIPKGPLAYDFNASVERNKLFDPNSLDRDEPSSILGLEASNLVHGALAHVIQLGGLAAAAKDLERSLIHPAANLTIDCLLAGNDRLLQELAFRGEVQTVVQNLGVVVCDKLIPQCADFTVQDEALQVNVSIAENSKTRGLVASTRLQTNEPVLNDIDPANTIPASNCVCCKEELQRIGDGLAFVFELSGETLLKVDSEILWLVRSLGRINRELPHIEGSLDIRILENASFVRTVGKVLIHGPRFGLCLRDWDTGLGGVLEQIIAAGEAVVKFRVAPRGNDLDVGLQSIECKLKADLVVSFAGTAMRDCNTALLLSDCNLATSDDRTSKGGSCGNRISLILEVTRNGNLPRRYTFS